MKFDWDHLPSVDASRVRLRPFHPNDCDQLYAIYSDPEVMRYWGDAPMKTQAQAEAFLAEARQDLRTRKCVQWGIARRSDDLVVGTFALFAWDNTAGKCEIGFALGRPYWSQGYMHESLQAALWFCFNELSLRRIEADVDPRNRPCIRLLEKLGFKQEGFLRERWLAEGQTQDSLFYGLLKREWQDPGLSYCVTWPCRSARFYLYHFRLRRWAAAIVGVLAQ